MLRSGQQITHLRSLGDGSFTNPSLSHRVYFDLGLDYDDYFTDRESTGDAMFLAKGLNIVFFESKFSNAPPSSVQSVQNIATGLTF